MNVAIDRVENLSMFYIAGAEEKKTYHLSKLLRIAQRNKFGMYLGNMFHRVYYPSYSAYKVYFFTQGLFYFSYTNKSQNIATLTSYVKFPVIYDTASISIFRGQVMFLPRGRKFTRTTFDIKPLLDIKDLDLSVLE